MLDLRDSLPDDQILPQSIWSAPIHTEEELKIYHEFREAYLASDEALLEKYQQWENYTGLVAGVRALAYESTAIRKWQIGCPCCEPGEWDSTSGPCSHCTDGAPPFMYLTISGVADDDCDCSYFNGVFELPYIGETSTICRWRLEDTWMCGEEEVPYVMQISLMETVGYDKVLTAILLIGSQDGLRPKTVHWQGDVNLGMGAIDCSATYEVEEWSLVDYGEGPKYCWGTWDCYLSSLCPNFVIN